MKNAFLIFALAIGLLPLSVAFGADKTTLILNWKPESEFGGFYAAQVQGFFIQQGLDVEILPGGSGTPALQMVSAGRATFGIAGADEIVMAQDRGADIVGIFATFQTSPQGIMVHSSTGMKSLEDVFSRPSLTIALQQGLPYAAFLKSKYGFGRAKIVPYQGGVTEFLRRKDFAQQCFVHSEPITAKKLGSDARAFLAADSGFNPYNVVVLARRDLITKNRALVDKFNAAVTQGWDLHLKDPSKTNQEISKLNPSLDAATLGEMALIQRPLIQIGKTPIGSMTEERWSTLAAQLKALGLIQKTKPAANYYLK